MKINKFIENTKKFNKTEKLFNIIFIPILFGILIGNLFLSGILERYFKDGNHPFWLYYLICFFGFLFFLLFGQLWRIKRKQIRYNLLCPLCKKRFNPNILPVIISTMSSLWRENIGRKLIVFMNAIDQ